MNLFFAAAVAASTVGGHAMDNVSSPVSPVKHTPIFQQHDMQQRYIVLFEQVDSLTSEEALTTQRALVQSVGGKTLHQLPSVRGAVVIMTPEAKTTLAADRHIRLIEPDQRRELAHAGNYAYGVEMVQAPLVGDAQAANQKVCIIDTGYDINHEDLPNGNNITGEISNTLTEAVDLGEWSQDTYGHGTHIAGTLAAMGNNIGLEGILPSGLLNIHNVKVIHNPNYWSIWASDMIAGIEKCKTAGATVVNMSIAGRGKSIAEEEAMEAAYEDGMLLIAAAGNRGSTDYFYPASYPSVVSVGAVDKNKNAWMFTQKNDRIELVAPGVNIKSTIPNSLYRAWDGTSMATPHVTGVAALVWSNFPACSNKQIRKVLTDTAEDLGEARFDRTYGHGLIQAKAAMEKLEAEGCATGDTKPRDIIEHVSGPSTLQSCGDGCFDLWIGRIGDNYWGGRCRIYEQAVTVRVSDPKAITSAVLNYAKWDDYMQVWLNDDKVWQGPNSNFPPETAGRCELSTSWQRNPGTNVTTRFSELDPDQELRFKIRVSVTGGGEGYARIRIRYNQ